MAQTYTKKPIAYLKFKFSGATCIKKVFFYISVDLHAVVRNNTERSCILFIQFPPMITSYITII